MSIMVESLEKEPAQSVSKELVGQTEVFVTGVHESWVEKDIKEFMTQFGRVMKVGAVRASFRTNQYYCFVIFENAESAKSSLGSVEFRGRTIKVKPSYKSQLPGPTDFNGLETNDFGSNHQNKKDNALLPSKLSKDSKFFDILETTASIPSSQSSREDVVVENIPLRGDTSNKENTEAANASLKLIQRKVGETKKKALRGAIRKEAEAFHLSPGKEVSLHPYLLLPSEPFLKFQPTEQPVLRIDFFTFPGRD